MTYATTPNTSKSYGVQKSFPFVPVRPFFDGTTNGTSPMMAPLSAPCRGLAVRDSPNDYVPYHSRIPAENKMLPWRKLALHFVQIWPFDLPFDPS